MTRPAATLPRMTDTSTEVTTVVDDYLAAWNERDEQRRAQLIERAWAPDGRLIDPPFDGEGTTASARWRPSCTSTTPATGSSVPAAWTCTTTTCGSPGSSSAPTAPSPSSGIDVADLAPDGRLARVVGFFGDLTRASVNAMRFTLPPVPPSERCCGTGGSAAA